METISAICNAAIRLCVLIIGVSLISACFSASQRMVDLGPVPEYQENNRITEVIGHENAADNDMPEWVARYVRGGLIGIETLPEYADSYVFIGRQTGNSLDALKLWEAGFSLDQDLPRLVSARIQARFIGSGRGNPGDEYGRYFETVIKNSSDSSFNGAIRESSFWIKKRTFGEDGVSPAGETYEYFILIKIEKETLVRQINMLLITSRPELTPSREQSAAAMRLRLNFYDGF
jgi:hypothetical protein